MSERRRQLGTRLAAGLAALAGVAYLALSFGSFRGMAVALDHAPRAFVDFVFVYYPAGKAVMESGEVVQGFFYSPFFALLIAPLVALPGASPLVIWILLQLLVALALGLAGLALVPERRALPTIAYALLLPLSFPLVHGFSWGQVSALLVALALWSLWLVERRMPRAGGVLLGLAASIKYYPVLLAFPWLAGREWRALVALGVVLVAALALLPAAFLGADGTLAFYAGVRGMIEANRELLVEDVNSQYFPHVFARWTGRAPESTATLPRIAGLVSWAFLGLAFALSFLAHRRRVERSLAWGVVLMLLATPFWVPTSWPHYFVYLPFVQLFVVAAAQAGGERSPLTRWSVGVLGALSALVSSVPFFQLVGGKEVYGASGALFLANGLLFVAAVAWLAPLVGKAGPVEAEKLQRRSVK